MNNLQSLTSPLLTFTDFIQEQYKSNARMPSRSQANITDFENEINTWASPHQKEAIAFMNRVTPVVLFEIMHSIRRWYSGQTMARALLAHRDSLALVMKLEPEDAIGLYRGFKVPVDNPLAQSQVGTEIILNVTRNQRQKKALTDFRVVEKVK